MTKEQIMTALAAHLASPTPSCDVCSSPDKLQTYNRQIISDAELALLGSPPDPIIGQSEAIQVQRVQLCPAHAMDTYPRIDAPSGEIMHAIHKLESAHAVQHHSPDGCTPDQHTAHVAQLYNLRRAALENHMRESVWEQLAKDLALKARAMPVGVPWTRERAGQLLTLVDLKVTTWDALVADSQVPVGVTEADARALLVQVHRPHQWGPISELHHTCTVCGQTDTIVPSTMTGPGLHCPGPKSEG